MSGCTYTFQCPSCGNVEQDSNNQAYVIVVPKNGCRPRTYEVCSECYRDMIDLMEGRGEKVIEMLEQEEHIPNSVWGHHE